MIEKTIARGEARRIYNRLGAGLDRAARFEGRAKARALDLLALTPGQHVLHVGVGTGVEHAALQQAARPRGLVVGCDLSRGMLSNAPTKTDELQMRTFWRRWRQLVSDDPALELAGP